MAPSLTVTLDLENHRTDKTGAQRYLANSERLLEFFELEGIRATIFVVGDVITEATSILTQAARGGHELALHSADHTPLGQVQQEKFHDQLRAARERLETISGRAVEGFRAPVFSLTCDTRWVTEVLIETGFRYSSSILPAANPLYGYPGAPQTPFRWPCSLIELPVPVTRIATTTLPFLGGIYLRYLPLGLVQKRFGDLPAGILPWSYLHPYDIDAGESYFRFPGTSAAMSLLLWRRRKATLERLRRLVAASGGAAPTLRDRVATLPEELPVFA